MIEDRTIQGKQSVAPVPWLGEPQQIAMLRIDVEGDTDLLIRMIGNLIKFWGSWFALEPHPDGRYDLHVNALDREHVLRHLQHTK